MYHPIIPYSIPSSYPRGSFALTTERTRAISARRSGGREARYWSTVVAALETMVSARVQHHPFPDLAALPAVAREMPSPSPCETDTSRLTLPAMLVAAAVTMACAPDGAYHTTGVVSASAYGTHLVSVSPGVSVIADYNEPVFYSDNYY